MLPSLLKNSKVTEVTGATAAGTTNINSTGVSMVGFETAAFLVSLGTTGADNGVKLQQSNDDGSTDAYADIAGSQILCNGTGKVVMSEEIRPTKKFVRAVTIRGTNTTINSVTSVRSGARVKSVDNNVTNTSAAKVGVSRGAGTA